MSAVHVHPRWVLWWAIWGGQAFMSLATVNVVWMRAVWAQFAVAEGWGATHRSIVWLPGGRAVLAGDTLSETSTWLSRFSKPGTPWWKSWNAAVSLFELPLICVHFFVTMAWSGTAWHPWWPLLLIPTAGLYVWLIYHWLNVTRYG